jgi:hypothetical protein
VNRIANEANHPTNIDTAIRPASQQLSFSTALFSLSTEEYGLKSGGLSIDDSLSFANLPPSSRQLLLFSIIFLAAVDVLIAEAIRHGLIESAR